MRHDVRRGGQSVNSFDDEGSRGGGGRGGGQKRGPFREIFRGTWTPEKLRCVAYLVHHFFVNSWRSDRTPEGARAIVIFGEGGIVRFPTPGEA